MVPLPVVVVLPGERVRVQLPVAGKPFNTTLPVGRLYCGCVIAPIMGGDGTGGGEGMFTFAVIPETHPEELVTVKLNTPLGIPDTVVLPPEPVVLTFPGYLINVHVPEEGNPLNITLPVEVVHVGGVMVPITGACGITGVDDITTSTDEGETHPDEFVTVNEYVPGSKAET